MSSGFKKALKPLILNIPYLGKVMSQRDRYLAERDAAFARLEVLDAEKQSLIHRNSELIQECEGLTGVRDNLIVERDNLIVQRDDLIVQRDDFQHGLATLRDTSDVQIKQLNLEKYILTQALIPHRPWLALDMDVPGIDSIPSLMSPEESLYLHWIAREYYEGVGEIFDGGPLLGGSTCALSSGLALNSRVENKHRRIHSYDLFLYAEYYMSPLFAGAGLKDGESFLPLFLKNTMQFKDYIDFHAGDVLTMDWTAGPLEIAFMDLVKSREINDHLVKQLFGALIPGRSIVAQQDYFHFYCYWIHLTMEYLKEYFSIVESPYGGTLSFLLKDKIPDELLEMPASEVYDKDRSLRLMDDSIARFRGLQKLKVTTAKIRLLAALDEMEAAAAVAREVRNSPDWIESGDMYCDILMDMSEAQNFIPRTILFPGVTDGTKLCGISRRYNIFSLDEEFFAVPATTEKFDVYDASDRNRDGVVKAPNFYALHKIIGENIMPTPPDQYT
jgi:hypothetical protein